MGGYSFAQSEFTEDPGLQMRRMGGATREEGEGGVGANLFGEVEVAVDQLQRGDDEEDEDSRQGHGRRLVGRRRRRMSLRLGHVARARRSERGIFFIFIFKKIKISKIYGRFENFQNYTPVAPCLGDRGPVAHWLGDRT